ASHVCTQASSRQVFAGLPLPSASGYNSHNMVAISVLPQGTSTPLHRAHAGGARFQLDLSLRAWQVKPMLCPALTG
ncbi:hypothetical protein, partial [Crenothrix polyspora]|uniref:hypothetical protein n=1 Tax=Crenothrix polyspora TaxID=360316 RepID=UPI001C3E0D28